MNATAATDPHAGTGPAHEHVVGMRWVDQDLFAHVNNAKYLDYAQEARAALVVAGDALAAQHPVHVNVDFLKPAHYAARYVNVSSSWVGRSLVQEISSTVGDTRLRHAVVTGHLDPEPVRAVDVPSGAKRQDAAARLSDAGPDGRVTQRGVFDLLQQFRIEHKDDPRWWDESGGFVIRSMAVDMVVPIRPGQAVTARSWVSSIGRRSYTLDVVMSVGDRVAVRSRSAMVGFDPSTERARTITDVERTLLSSMSGTSPA